MIGQNSVAILKILFHFQFTLIADSPSSGLQRNKTRGRKSLNSGPEGSLGARCPFQLGEKLNDMFVNLSFCSLGLRGNTNRE